MSTEKIVRSTPSKNVISKNLLEDKRMEDNSRARAQIQEAIRKPSRRVVITTKNRSVIIPAGTHTVLSERDLSEAMLSI